MVAIPLELPKIEPIEESGELQHFKAGQVIFREREIGGSLHFIKSGEVEIYQSKQGSEVVLATLKSGEVIGTMSLLTKERRLASARAKTDVTTLYIDTVNVDQLIESVPFWVKTVIKDFVFRIQNINSRYCQLMIAHQKHEAEHQNKLLLAKQCAIGLSVFSHYVTLQNRDLNLNECLAQLAAIIQRPISELKEIINVFVTSGLISNRAGAPPILHRNAIDALQIFSQTVQANIAEKYSGDTLEKLLLISEKIASRHGKTQTPEFVEIETKLLSISKEELDELAGIPRLAMTFTPDHKSIRLNSRALGALLSSLVAIEMFNGQNANYSLKDPQVLA